MSSLFYCGIHWNRVFWYYVWLHLLHVSGAIALLLRFATIESFDVLVGVSLFVAHTRFITFCIP